MTDEFLTRHPKSPRPEFAEALYRRISRPMYTQPSLLTHRRLALALLTLTAVTVFTLAASPGARAAAGELWRQIGAIVLVREPVPDARPTAVPPTDLKASLAATAAEAGRIAGFGVLAPGYLPDGYRLADPWAVLPQGAGVIVVSHYTGAEGHFLHLDQFQPGPGDLYEQSLEDSRDVIVRGRPGLWITGRQFHDSAGAFAYTTNWLMWEENGINYTLYSDALGLDEMLKVAESLAP